jgi:NAD-dependent SIR2 family protein deacetylase
MNLLCVKCKKEKDESNFYFHKHRNKYDNTCKECRKEVRTRVPDKRIKNPGRNKRLKIERSLTKEEKWNKKLRRVWNEYK